MIVKKPSPQDIASVAAAEGSYALGTGDTRLAAEKYAKAGRQLEKEASAARKSTERNLLRFLAASQFFHGGDYEHALKVCRRVEEKLLPVAFRQQFGTFKREVVDRAHPGYRQEMKKRLAETFSAAGPQATLDLLKSHPYVYERADLAFRRAYLCEELRQYEAAAAFHASAMRFRPQDVKLALTSTALLQRLSDTGRLDEAVEYLRYQLAEIGHPATFVCATVISP